MNNLSQYSVQDFLSFKGNECTEQDWFCTPKAYKEKNIAGWPLLNDDNQGLYPEHRLLSFLRAKEQSLCCQVSVHSLIKLFLINRLRLIVLIDKEELSTQSFNNKGELLAGSLWWGDYFLLALGCNEDCKHLCSNSLLAKARNYLGGKTKQ